MLCSLLIIIVYRLNGELSNIFFYPLSCPSCKSCKSCLKYVMPFIHPGYKPQGTAGLLTPGCGVFPAFPSRCGTSQWLHRRCSDTPVCFRPGCEHLPARPGGRMRSLEPSILVGPAGVKLGVEEGDVHIYVCVVFHLFSMQPGFSNPILAMFDN